MKEIQIGPARSPTVTYLVSVLKERIRSGVYPSGKCLPSERALSDEFAVSRPLVRQAISELEEHRLIRRAAGHRPLVWNGTGENAGSPGAITTAAHSVSARNLALWISGNPQDYGALAVIRGISQTVAESQYRLVLAGPRGTTQAEWLNAEKAALLELARDPDIAGVMLWYLGGESNRTALMELRQSGKPLVFIDRRPPAGFEADFVGVYNEHAAQTAVRHLLDQGHRRIVHITNNDSASAVQERVSGYRQALRAADVPFRSELLVNAPFLPNDNAEEEQWWQRTVNRLLCLPEPPTAVFTVNDYTAFRLIVALRNQGLRVPEDIAVVGFDDIERWSPRPPFMSSISQPFELMGTEAVKLLQLRLEEGETNAYRHVLLSAALVVRASSSKILSGFASRNGSGGDAG